MSKDRRFNELDNVLKSIARHTTDDPNQLGMINSLEMAADKSAHVTKLTDKVKNYQRENDLLREKNFKETPAMVQ